MQHPNVRNSIIDRVRIVDPQPAPQEAARRPDEAESGQHREHRVEAGASDPERN